jgi:SAM-dependent methyltransferase
MTDRELIAEKARAFFEDLWRRGDPRDLEGSMFERERDRHLLGMLSGRCYGRTLELRCGRGSFTRLLCRVADHVVALDISPTAIAHARTSGIDPSVVDFREANIMDYDVRAEGPWDLVVMNETISYLGWLYSFFDVAWLAAELFASTGRGGRLMVANTCGGVYDYLLRPWLIRTYRALFLNIGYRLETEEVFRGAKHGVDLEVLVSLFVKAPEETLGRRLTAIATTS